MNISTLPYGMHISILLPPDFLSLTGETQLSADPPVVTTGSSPSLFLCLDQTGHSGAIHSFGPHLVCCWLSDVLCYMLHFFQGDKHLQSQDRSVQEH